MTRYSFEDEPWNDEYAGCARCGKQLSLHDSWYEGLDFNFERKASETVICAECLTNVEALGALEFIRDKLDAHLSEAPVGRGGCSAWADAHVTAAMLTLLIASLGRRE